MSIRELRKIRQLYFTYQDLADLLRISPKSAMVSCSRYVRSGDLVRLKRNYYILRERWENLSRDEAFILANLLQVPSYISLTTALVYYGYTTQIQQDFVESVATKRSREFHVREVTFNFTKIKKEYYSDFIKEGEFFIAGPEKALIDAVYLSSMKRYRLDVDSLDMEKFNTKKILKIVSNYPARVQKLLGDLCGI
jgi:predicted transcriptional regulator of viral defense system